MTSLDRSPTTTKKLRFFSWTPLRMSAGMRESLYTSQSDVQRPGELFGVGFIHCLFHHCLIRLSKVRCRDIKTLDGDMRKSQGMARKIWG